MLIATERDFDLSKKPPRDGFLHLRHPESFRACLVQVSTVKSPVSMLNSKLLLHLLYCVKYT